MSEFLPILMLFLVWWMIGSAARKQQQKKKNQLPFKKDAGKSGPGAARSAPGAGKEDAPKPAESHAHDRGTPYQGSLGPASGEGVDPCHDDMSRMPSGSLRAAVAEGNDPCHDDYDRMPSGSLRVETPEGTDPCHADFPAAAARTESPAQTDMPGLNLRVSGEEMVKGFVWGEILNRRRA